MSDYPPVNRLWLEKLSRLQDKASVHAVTVSGPEDRKLLRDLRDALQEARIIIERLEVERAERRSSAREGNRG